MIKKLHTFYVKQTLNPGFLSIFINPFFIIRRGLQAKIKSNASVISGKILDFGCGSKPYKHLFNNITEYIGLDIENEGHDHKTEEVDVYYDGKIIPFENSSFDSVFSSEVLEHVFNVDEMLEEINRVIKINGNLLITVPFVWGEHEIPNDFGRYTSFGIQYLFEKHGFEVIKIEKNGHFSAVVFQLIILYLHDILFTKNKYLNIIINFLFIAPLTVIGIILKTIFWGNKSLYFNNIVVAKKIK